jgi:hypothetical protein
VGGASWKLLKIKVQICNGFCKQEERGGCKGSVRVKRARRRGRISYRARWPFEIPLEDGALRARIVPKQLLYYTQNLVLSRRTLSCLFAMGCREGATRENEGRNCCRLSSLESDTYTKDWERGDLSFLMGFAP